jgi:hypothetical protein
LEAVIALASRHLVLPSIAARLSKDAPAGLDPDLLAFFEQIRAGNERRNQALLEEAFRVAALANQVGIQPILLKGAAHLADDLYGDPGGRFVSDIDLLVEGNERDRLQRALEDQGYRTPAARAKEPGFWDDHHHAAPLIAPDGGFAIEVHSDTLHNGGAVVGLDVRAIASRAVERCVGDAHFRLPSVDDRAVHCLAHNQLGHNDRFVGEIEMRDLLDLHFLTRRGPLSDAAWIGLLDRFARAGHGDLAAGFVAALQTMVPTAALGPCPAGGDAAKRHQARYLRRQRQSRFSDPSLYLDLLAREWHRLSAFDTYRRQLQAYAVDPGYWRRRWRNLLGIIRRY